MQSKESLYTKKTAIVPLQSIFYLFSINETQSKNNEIIIPEDIHLTILKSVSDSRSLQ